MAYEELLTADDLERAATALAQTEAIGVDTETTGLDPWRDRLRLIQLATPETVYLIDADRWADLGPIKDVLEAARPFKVLHHAKFDAKFLARRYGVTLGGVVDTLVASQLLGASDGAGHGLAAVAARYLDVELDKSFQRADWRGPLSEGHKRYAAKDAEILLPLRRVMREALLNERLVRVAALEFPVAPVLGYIELAGMRLDPDLWRQVAAERSAEHERLASELQQELGAANPQLTLFPGVGSLNLNSVPQVMRALAHMGLEVPDTDDLTLGPLASTHPVIAKLLEYRHAAKALSSYGEQFLGYIRPETGRIHADFHQLGADTGRMAASNPNLQQIPNQERYRACFVPDPGNVLVIADYSQIELRILAEVSSDPNLLHAFETGVDLHRLTASRMFGVPLESVDKEQRQRAKALNFGMVYGMGPTGLAVRIQSTLEEARELIDRYFESYPGVRRWLAQAARQAVETGECWTLGGRRIRFGRPDPENRRAVSGIERVGKNAPLQGTSADITKRAIAMLHTALAGEGRIVNVVHDEVVVEAPRESASGVAEVMRRELVAAGMAYLKRVPVEVEVGTATAWTK